MKKPSGYVWTCFSCGKKSAWGDNWRDVFNVGVFCSDTCVDSALCKGSPEMPMCRYRAAVRCFSEWKKQKGGQP